MTGLDCYRTIGMSEGWLQDFLESPRDWPANSTLGISQREAMIAWLDHAGLRDRRSGEPTALAETLSHVSVDPPTRWCILWTELVIRSALAGLYLQTVPAGSRALRRTLLAALMQHVAERTAQNALRSLASTFDRTPLGDDLGLGIVTRRGGACAEVARRERVQVPPVALIYALYRYAETIDQHALSLTQIAEDREAGPAYWFGASAADLDSALRGLSSQYPGLLRTELARGLDSVFLEPELSAADVLGVVLQESGRDHSGSF